MNQMIVYLSVNAGILAIFAFVWLLDSGLKTR